MPCLVEFLSGRGTQTFVGDVTVYVSLRYTDLNRDIAAQTGQTAFDFSSPEGRNAMGQILADVVEETKA